MFNWFNDAAIVHNAVAKDAQVAENIELHCARFHLPYFCDLWPDLLVPIGKQKVNEVKARSVDTNQVRPTSSSDDGSYRFAAVPDYEIRLEVATNNGPLSYSTVLADYRRYFRLPGKLTFAARALHYGRYGGGAEDSRLQELSLGYAALVRGYTIGSYSAGECGIAYRLTATVPPLTSCLEVESSVANAELRLPLFGPFAAIPSRRVPPVEAAAFFDTGAAWKKGENMPVFQNNSRHPVRRYGATLRANLLGFAIGQVSYVRPMDRGRGWHLEFAFTAGF